jgi:hypothetical protein
LIFGNSSKVIVFSIVFAFTFIGLFLLVGNVSYLLAVMASRNAPLIYLIVEGFNLKTLLGTGFGVGIEIPWFKAVPGLANRAVFYDNMYGTIFIKFGLLGCIGLALFLYKLKAQSVFMCVVLIVAGLGGSVFYQNSFIFALYFASVTLQRKDQRLI